MGSARLPGKVLKPIAGLPLLAHVTGRLAGLRHEATIVVATGTAVANEAISAWCAASGIACFRGSESDVLARYHDCAVQYGFTQVVRLTGDNPFTDVEELDRLIELHLAQENDFTYSFSVLPVGVGAEVFSSSALERTYRQGLAPHHREHVDEYLLENCGQFRTGALEVPAAKQRCDIRLTVDTEEDYRRACYIAERVRGQWATTEEAIDLCSRFA